MVIVIRNSHIVEKSDLNLDYCVRPNNSAFLLVELGFLNLIFFVFK